MVHLAIDNVTGGEVAVKLIERGGATSSGVLRSELINHSALGHHPHVIALKVCLNRGSHHSLSTANMARCLHTYACSRKCMHCVLVMRGCTCARHA